MEDLANSRPDLRLRKIDIKKWGSPVARQHGIRRLPSLVLYEGDRLVSSDSQKVYTKIMSR